MATWYGSFLARYWRLADGRQQIEIEHIQSGDRALLTSLSATLDWILAREHEPDAGGAPAHRPKDET